MGAPVVTIDGPSGAGKGTVSRLLATRTGWHLLDSGALYRLVALAGINQALDREDVDGHARLARTMQCEFGQDSAGAEQIRLGSEVVTARIRGEAMGGEASRVAAWPQVRAALLDRQREFAAPPGLIADGRDMGTVVFPLASLKVFLTASADERALRRYNQLKGKESGVSLAALSREIAERDRRDASRAVAPLVPAADALVLDTTSLDALAATEQIMAWGRMRALWA